MSIKGLCIFFNFKGTGNYLSQADWTNLWQKALKSSYKPIVNVEAVWTNKSKGKSSLLASTQETAKYQVKSADYMTDDDNRNQQVIDDLEQALAGTLQIGYGGLLKQIKQQYNNVLGIEKPLYCLIFPNYTFTLNDGE